MTCHTIKLITIKLITINLINRARHSREPPYLNLSAPFLAAFRNVSYAFMMSFIAKR